MSKTYRLFISHSWAYDSERYEKMLQFFYEQGLDYYNHSVPIHDPIHTNGTDRQLRDAIEAKIRGTSCIIILAGVSSSYSRWIDKEIVISNFFLKPIIAVEPWGAERTSQIVKQNAHRIVKWQGKSIVDAIRELG